MAQQTVIQEGAFTKQSKDAINSNFSELYGTEVGGALPDGEILVGSAGGAAAAVAMSGDAEIANDGEVTVTGINGAAITATGTELDAAEAIIAAIPTSNQSSPAIWNDNGVLKVGTA